MQGGDQAEGASVLPVLFNHSAQVLWILATMFIVILCELVMKDYAKDLLERGKRYIKGEDEAGKAEKDAAEKASRERDAAEKALRDAAEKALRERDAAEKALRDAAEKASRERDAAEKALRDAKHALRERDAAEKALRERDAAEKASRDAAAAENAEKAKKAAEKAKKAAEQDDDDDDLEFIYDIRQFDLKAEEPRLPIPFVMRELPEPPAGRIVPLGQFLIRRATWKRWYLRQTVGPGASTDDRGRDLSKEELDLVYVDHLASLAAGGFRKQETERLRLLAVCNRMEERIKRAKAKKRELSRKSKQCRGEESDDEDNDDLVETL